MRPRYPGRRGATAALAAAALAPIGAASAHADHVHAAAWTACEAATLADACEYADHHENVHRGSCRLVSDALLCVRNRPIERPGATSDASSS